MTNEMTGNKPLIMLIGVGNLSANLLNMLLARPETSRVVLAGRNPEAYRRRANLARFTAYNLGIASEPDVVALDLWDIERTTETLSAMKPDIIFMGASLQSWRIMTELPNGIFEALDEAQFGPWLPMHLTLNYLLMQAVKKSGIDCKVVNAAFPDAVGPVLAKVGLAPTIGIGNVANIVPALTHSAASLLQCNPSDVELRLTTQHYFSHYVPRFGKAGRGRYHISIKAKGQEVGDLISHQDLFAGLNGPFKRIGGVDGQVLTASSAARIIRALTMDQPILAHAPAPNGLPGGYPVRISSNGIELDLDNELSVEEAISTWRIGYEK